MMMKRSEYDLLVLEGADAIHKLGCMDEEFNGCRHKPSLTSGDALEANAVLGVVFAALGQKVPPEGLCTTWWLPPTDVAT